MKKTVLTTLLCLFLLSGCSNEPPDRKGKIDNVQKVFMHEPSDYSVMWMGEDNTIKVRRFHDYSAKILLKADVPADQPMWVEWRGWKSTSHPNEDLYVKLDRVVIHVHSVDNVNGGGWDHGKFGRGQTQEIAK